MANLQNLNKKTFYFSLLVITFIFYISFNILALNDPIVVQHGFRQTHNALISYYLIQNGFSFAYETPNWGEPWSVPHEFPIYQWIVDAIRKQGWISNNRSYISYIRRMDNNFSIQYSFKFSLYNKRFIFRLWGVYGRQSKSRHH